MNLFQLNFRGDSIGLLQTKLPALEVETLWSAYCDDDENEVDVDEFLEKVLLAKDPSAERVWYEEIDV